MAETSELYNAILTGNANKAEEAAKAVLESGGDPNELVHAVHRAFRERMNRYAGDLESTVAQRTAALRRGWKAFATRNGVASSSAGPDSTTPTTLASGRESSAWLRPSANSLWSSAIIIRIICCPIRL